MSDRLTDARRKVAAARARAEAAEAEWRVVQVKGGKEAQAKEAAAERARVELEKAEEELSDVAYAEDVAERVRIIVGRCEEVARQKVEADGADYAEAFRVEMNGWRERLRSSGHPRKVDIAAKLPAGAPEPAAAVTFGEDEED